MFTLKLFRRRADHSLFTKVFTVDHVETIEIPNLKAGDPPRTLEIRAFENNVTGYYENYYVGERTAEMTALTDENHFGWGLLENSAGKTTEHFRPYTYG